MTKIAEPVVQLLFLILSIFAAVLPAGAYVNYKAWTSLFLTNVINGFIAGLYLFSRFILRKKTTLEKLQRAMLLFIIYSCLPVLVIVSNPVARILSIVCFAGAFAVFILKNIDSRDAESFSELKIRGRVLFSILLLLFGLGVLVRGANVIYQYAVGMSTITDMLVSISDIIISVIWCVVGVGLIRKKAFGESNVLPCYLQASLLFIGLIVFLVLNPLVIDAAIDFEAVIVIAVMGLFFFVPTIILLRNKKG